MKTCDSRRAPPRTVGRGRRSTVSWARYRISLHFAEIYPGMAFTPNRNMNLRVEDQPVATEFDPYGETGWAAASVKTVEVDVNDEWLDIRLESDTQDLKISGVEIEPSDG